MNETRATVDDGYFHRSKSTANYADRTRKMNYRLSAVGIIPINHQTFRINIYIYIYILRSLTLSLSKLIPPTFMRHLPEGRLGGGRARVGHPRAQQGSCRVQRRRRRLPASRCRSARRVIRSAVTFGDAAATAASARTKVQAQPTAADRAAAASSAAVPTAATSGHANTVLKSLRTPRSSDTFLQLDTPAS